MMNIDTQAPSTTVTPTAAKKKGCGCGCGSAAANRTGDAPTNDDCHGNTNGVGWHLGGTINHPVVVPVYWDQFFLNNPHVSDNMGKFLSDLVTNYWIDDLGQYGVNRGRVSGPVFINPKMFPTPAPGMALTETQLQNNLISWLDAGVVQPKPSSGVVYLIFPPFGIDLSLDGKTSFCGYHYHGGYHKSLPTDSDTLIWATFKPKNFSADPTGQRFVDKISYCVSHELAEMLSNPSGYGYFTSDTHGCEIGDLCEQEKTGGLITVPYFNWTVERYWSNRQGGCVISPNYGLRIFDGATTFGNESDGTWTMADYDRDGIPDLVFIKTANTPSGHVEVHIASGASGYKTRIFESATTFGNETDGTWVMADYDGDGIPDLVLIKTANTAGGRVEVHIASGASRYQTRILEVVTPFGNETDGVWTMTRIHPGGRPDLVFIKTANTPSGRVEVHAASGASNYQTRSLDMVSSLAIEADGTWTMADYDGDGVADLVFIRTGPASGTNTVEVHAVSGRSNYQSSILDSPSVYLPEADGKWMLMDFNRDGVPDLIFIKTANTPGNLVEVHVAKGVR